MLALKVVLAEVGDVPVLVFDEVDRGVGGATADAVGERLQALARQFQVLVVTYSPQVAARASRQWLIAKRTDETATTSVEQLDGDERCRKKSRGCFPAQRSPGRPERRLRNCWKGKRNE